MMVTYALAMTTSPFLTAESKYEVGWMYIFICVTNLLFNFAKISKKMVFEAIPQIYRDYKKKQEKLLFKKKLDKWID